MLLKTVLPKKIKEALASVMPITAIVFILCFSIAPVSNGILMGFCIGAVLLTVGMGLFTLGTDLAMTPIGKHVGSAITHSRSLFVIIAVSLVMGTIVTLAEPDLQVLSNQVQNIPNSVLIPTVAVGVGLFLVMAMLRILLKVRLSYLLIGFYIIVFIMAYFVDPEFLAVAFDSGGVTTGPMTVPFIMALGLGVATTRTDSNAETDSFGLVALCSVGPVIAVLILGMIYKPDGGAYQLAAVPEASDSARLAIMFLHGFKTYMKEAAVSLTPVIAFFLFFQIVRLKLRKAELLRIFSGVLYTYVGLVLFLTGANVGFMPVGRILGENLEKLPYSWIIVPIGMLIGFFVVMAEPAVTVLNNQVEEISAGAIPGKTMLLTLSAGTAVSIGLALLRIVLHIPIVYFLLPGYLIAGVLTFFSPPIFTAIAFDSGGVASGPMTAAFLVPLSLGVCVSAGGNILTEGFGIVALVAMTPLIAIQILGCVYKARMKRTAAEIERSADEDAVIEV